MATSDKPVGQPDGPLAGLRGIDAGTMIAGPHCGRASLARERVSGKGRIVSFTKVHRPQRESFFAEAPYCFIAVRLDEGPLLFSRLTAEGEVAGEGLILCFPLTRLGARVERRLAAYRY